MEIEINRSLYDDADSHQPKLIAPPGVNEKVINLISETKEEPQWMRTKRLKALELWGKTPLPNWGPSLKELDIDKITFFVELRFIYKYFGYESFFQ